MDTQVKKPFLVQTEIYHQASSDLLALKSGLPQEAVVSLAREVLTRLAGRISETAIRSDVIIGLCDALVTDDSLAAAKLIEEQYQAGVTVEALYLGFLAPAARQLGEWWTDDKISFADVTVGTGRIYGIMRSLSRRLPPPDVPESKAAMVACVPGETHTMGAKMATDLLRKEGWTIDMELALDHEQLVARIVDSRHMVIALSAAGEHSIAALAQLVLAVRVNQPHATILISGNIVEEAGDRIGLMGVEGMSQNFAEASAMLNMMWERVSVREH